MSGVDDNSFDVKTLLANLSHRPGVYRMLDAKSRIIYVGKAKDLKRRVSSYFQGRALDAKTMALVGQVTDLEVTVTRTESEALMLEYNLIKEHKPRFNVVLRDDKSYPYISISTDHDFPRLSFYREGAKALWSLSQRWIGARNSASATEALSSAPMPRLLFCQSPATLPAIPDSALYRSMRWSDIETGLRPGREACAVVFVR